MRNAFIHKRETNLKKKKKNTHIRGTLKGTGKNVNSVNRLKIYKGLLAKED